MHALPTSGEDRAVLLPPGAVPLDYVITEIASISQRGAEAANPSPGEVAVVVGQGLIGALSAAWLRAAGCHVIVTDFEQSRLDRALKGWAHAAVNGRESDAEARLQALLDGGVFLTPGDRSLDGRQKSVRALQSGALRSSAFLDQVVDYRQAAEVYRSLQDEKDRIFSAVFDWTNA